MPISGRIKVFSVPRSGHWAVWNWVCQNMPGGRLTGKPPSSPGLTVDNEEGGVLRKCDDDCLLVMRDHYNWTASVLKALPHGTARRRSLVEGWISDYKQQANEALGRTDLLPKKIVVLFNSWVSDSDYRAQLAARLGCVTDDKGLDDVMMSGSSFDGHDFAGRGRQMDVLNRWRQMLDNEEWLGYAQDDELVSITSRLFPEMDVIL